MFIKLLWNNLSNICSEMDFNDLDGLGVDTINIHDVLGDPELLAELHSLGWNDHQHPPQPKTPEDQEKPLPPDNKNVISTPSAVELPPELDDSKIQLEDADFNDPELMKMYEMLSDDNSDARPSSNTMQPIPSAVATMADKPSLPNRPLPSPKPEKNDNVTVPQSMSSPPISSNTGSRGNAFPNPTAVVTAEEAKRKAIEAKRAGNTEEALYWFRISKEQQKPVNPSNTPSISNKDTVQNKANSSISVFSALQSFDPNFTALEAALTEASRTSLAAAKVLRETEPQQAVLHMRDYKRYEQDLATLRVRRTIPGAHPPSFRWAVTQKKISLERLELGEDELRVQVEGVYEIDALVKEHKVKDVWAEISVGSAGKESELGTQRTSTVKFDSTAKCALWKFQSSFPVIKRSKVSQATQLRKRVTLKIVGQKAGMLWSSTVDLAVASVSFADLAAVCECGGRTPLFQITQGEDGGLRKGKAVGGYVMLTLQVRKPLSGADTRTVEERQLVLEPWPPLPTTPPPPSKSAIELSPIAASSASVNAVGANASQTSTSNYGASLTDREKTDPEAVDFLESNDVLEAEITTVQQQIQSGHLDEDAMFNATLRLQLLQVKLQTLVLRVQNETLSLEDYLQVLRDRIQRDKQMALYLSKTVGDAEAKEVAVRILRRMKIMQQEIDNASAAGEDEEAT